ncbi:MAG: hypothetical protein CSYNP_03732 [Syntrophus sp. SKADARSKE-3]|nr:hypothetical protein [Syntrophus sp. SKADARSKE-3]
MKIIKPQKLSIQFKIYEEGGRCFFFPAIFMLFPFDTPAAIRSEVALWKLVAEKLGKDVILDMGMPKVQGEALVSGACHTPYGTPQRACSVAMRIGEVNKTLSVLGNRYWNSLGGISQPEQFTTMPLTWQYSFGGSGYELNPHGKGYGPIMGENGNVVYPLPNIQYPREMIGSTGERPIPAGFAPLDITWPQRSCKVGTYGKEWLETQFPGYAADMDPIFFNTAQEDQWLNGFFTGDEAFSLEHMHPEQPLLAGQLPSLTARCFIRRVTDEPGSLEEIAMRLETVHFLPEAKQGILIFRGGTEIATDDADEISLVVAAAEKKGEPKASEHYREVVTKRLDREMGAVHSLCDSDLLHILPEMAGTDTSDEITGMERLLTKEDLLRKNMRVGIEKKLSEAREHISRLGINPNDHLPVVLPPDPEPVNMEKLDVKLLELEEITKKARADAVLKQAEAERMLKDLCANQGLDYEQLLAEAKTQRGGRPKFSADQQLKQIKDLQVQLHDLDKSSPELDRMIADPGFERKLRMAEEKIQEVYRKYAQHFPPSPVSSPEDARRLREMVLAGFETGSGFAGADLSGADLSGLSLTKVDFRDAILEGVNFEGSDLTGADFTNAVLAGANLTRVKGRSAKFSGANIGRAILKDADLSGGLDMRGVVLAKSDLTGARFNDADLTEADLSECIFLNTDLSGITAPQLIFISSDLKGLCSAGADLSEGIFIETDVGGVDFSEAKLSKAVFVSAKGEGTSFKGADLENLRVVKESTFAGADFREAKLDRANLRGTNLAACSFERASLNHADLSQCVLRNGNLRQALARGTRFEKTDLTGVDLVAIDLMQGSLRKAQFHGADFRGANLYEVDFEKAKGDRCTDFRQANLKKTRIIAWKPTKIGQ